MLKVLISGNEKSKTFYSNSSHKDPGKKRSSAHLVGRHVDLIRWSLGWDHKRRILPCKSKHHTTKIALLRGQDHSADCPTQRSRSLSRMPCSEAKITQQISLLRGQDHSADCPPQRPRSLSRLPCSEAKIAQQIALLRGQDRLAEAHAFPSTTWNLSVNLQNWLLWIYIWLID